MKPGAMAPVLAALTLAGCAGAPPPPDWQLESHAAVAAHERLWFAGRSAAADAEFARAQRETGRTGRLDLAARLELVRCALRVASLDLEPCAAFEARRADASPGDAAYADFLAGRWTSLDAVLLPVQYRALVAATEDPIGALAAIESPRSRLVAAGALLRVGRLSPAGIDLAIATASAQGWRRPLLAWLGVALRQAESAGRAQEAAQLRRRIVLVGGEAAPQ